MTPRRSVALYYLLQGVVGVAFWVAVRGSDVGRKLFELLPGHARVTDAFLWADLAAIAATLVCAWAVERDHRLAGLASAFTAGCLVYPTLYLVAWAPTSPGAARCLAIMVPPALISSWLAVRVARGV